jgi:uncharacterized protein
MLTDRAPWYIAGPLIGLIIVVLRALLNKPFGALGGYIDLLERVSAPRRWGVPAFIAIGTVIGGGWYATVTKSFGPTWDYGPGIALMPATAAGQFVVLTLAGVVMGFGARLAGGCTSGHGLCGMSLGSSASIVSTITFFATAVVLAHVFASLAGGS